VARAARVFPAAAPERESREQRRHDLGRTPSYTPRGGSGILVHGGRCAPRPGQVYQFLQTLPHGLDAATYGPSVTWRSTLPRWRPEFYAKHPAQTWAEALDHLRADGVRYFLIHHSPLDVFSPTIPELEAAVQRVGTPVRVFSPYRPGVQPPPVYDRVDAYFFPVGRFRGLERPGPLVNVYRLD